MASPIYALSFGAIDVIDPISLQGTARSVSFPAGSYVSLLDIAGAPDGTLYGISTNTSRLYRLDLAGDHYNATLIGSLGVNALSAFAIDSTGQGYFIALDTLPTSHGELYRLNLSTASVTAIGDTGERFPADLAFYDGQLYLAGLTVGMATVNTSSGAATPIAGLDGFQASGLAKSGSALYVTSNYGIGVFDPQTSKLDALVSWANFGIGAASTDVSPPSSDPQTIVGPNGGTDYLVGGNGDDLIFGGNFGNVIVGLGGDDHLFGGDGQDTFYAGTGANFMAGGKSDDSYNVDSASDAVSEIFGEGNDTVYASVTYTLPDYVEKLVLVGNSAIGASGNSIGGIIQGNSAANVIHGGAGNDIIFGGGGADQLFGGAGNDQIGTGLAGAILAYGEDGDDLLNGWSGDDTLNGGAGTDGISGGDGNDVLYGGDGNDYLQGQAGNDDLHGGAGRDQLLGGPGIDYMEGGPGDDIYYLTFGDTILEQLNGGDDTVYVTLAAGETYLLAANVENVQFVGSGSVIGNSLRNGIFGSNDADVIAGGGGGDYIDGKAGADRIAYLDPSDSIIGGVDTLMNFEHGSDIIDLHLVAPTHFTFTPNGAFTTVIIDTQSGVTMTIGVSGTATMADFLLPVNEVVGTGGSETLKGNVGVDHIQGFGGNDVLYGYEDNDILDGGTGVDTMVGGPGDDTYYVDHPGDFPAEKNGEGADTVISSVSFTLRAFIDNLTLAGTGDLNGTGNDPVHTPGGSDYSGDNVLTGNSGANALSGLGGNDTLYGAGGPDQLSGGAGNDTFRYVAVGDSFFGALDHILDFASGDRIDLSPIDAIAGGSDDEFAFVGAASFSHTAGELRAFQQSPGNWQVESDIDGDGTADLVIAVTTDHPLTSTDFVL